MSIFDGFKTNTEFETLKKFKEYKSRCKNKGLKFSIKLEEFKFQIKRPCYICQKPQSNGLDRIDNTKGYTPYNIYPCCFDCNRMKSNKTREEFIEYLGRLNPNHKLLLDFNRLKNYSEYNNKVKSIRKLLETLK